MDQHFLPKCYLKEFCNTQKQLYSFNLKAFKTLKRYPKPICTNTSKICYASDFYTIDEELKYSRSSFNIEDPLIIEKHFSKVYESKYPRLIDELKKLKAVLPAQDAAILGFALISIKIRNKFYRENAIAKILPSVIDKISTDYLGQLEKEEEWEKFPKLSKEKAIQTVHRITMSTKNDKNLSKDLHLLSFLNSQSDEHKSMQIRILKELMKYKWIVVINNNSIPFITTDNPGYCIDELEKVHNTKFSAPFIYAVPLTPKLYLWIDARYTDDVIDEKFKNIYYYNAPEPMVKMYNKASLLNITSHFYSFSNINYQYLFDFIEEREMKVK